MVILHILLNLGQTYLFVFCNTFIQTILKHCLLKNYLNNNCDSKIHVNHNYNLTINTLLLVLSTSTLLHYITILCINEFVTLVITN